MDVQNSVKKEIRSDVNGKKDKIWKDWDEKH
jgi:hypothetical protein